MTCGIYLIKNNISKKEYIGQSINIEKRWKDHKKDLRNNIHKNQHLQNAYNKYGENNFNFYILEECDKSILNDKEKFYIKKRNTYKCGYNMNSGGNSYIAKNPKEKKKKISSYNKGKVLSQITKNKISLTQKKQNQLKLNNSISIIDANNFFYYVIKYIQQGKSKKYIFNNLSKKYKIPYHHLNLYLKKYILWDSLYYIAHLLKIKEQEQIIILLFIEGYTQLEIAKKLQLNKKIFSSFCNDNNYKTPNNKNNNKKKKRKKNTNYIPQKNKTGYYRVDKQSGKRYKNGFIYRYSYRENNKYKYLKSTNIKKLKNKVIKKGLPWIKLQKTS